MARKLRIAIDCRIADPQQGIGTAVLALAKAFSDSDVTDQEYTFIVRESMKGWLAPYVYGPCKLECIPESTRSAAKAVLRRVAPLRFIWRKLHAGSANAPTSDGYVEAHQFDLVHFPTQEAYLTKLPTIYQPHDLQHLHYPEFFSKVEFSARERLYRIFCERAAYICVHGEWTKQDIVRHYKVAEQKIVVIPWGSVLDAYQAPSAAEIQATLKKHRLPESFFFYPAATWPHKNHEMILRALHILKNEDGTVFHVVFTGSSTDHRRALDKLAHGLGISEQLHFLGFVTPMELQAIFKTATAMIYASRFEGFGLPILEAFQARLPVISSNVTTLPEVAGDGALFFDPDSPAELAALMRTVLNHPKVRQDLIRRANVVLSKYSFRNTAANFQALYEKTAASLEQPMGHAAKVG
jgi:glycosyltransferase involved in cell wall biosynthesis